MKEADGRRCHGFLRSGGGRVRGEDRESTKSTELLDANVFSG